MARMRAEEATHTAWVGGKHGSAKLTIPGYFEKGMLEICFLPPTRDDTLVNDGQLRSSLLYVESRHNHHFRVEEDSFFGGALIVKDEVWAKNTGNKDEIKFMVRSWKKIKPFHPPFTRKKRAQRNKEDREKRHTPTRELHIGVKVADDETIRIMRAFSELNRVFCKNDPNEQRLPEEYRPWDRGKSDTEQQKDKEGPGQETAPEDKLQQEKKGDQLTC